MVFRVPAKNDALCIYRGKFAKSVPSSKDASRSRLRHLCSIPFADVRLLFDSCPDVVCIWSAETVRHLQQGDKLTWATFRAAFPIPDECLEATQKTHQAGVCVCVSFSVWNFKPKPGRDATERASPYKNNRSSIRQFHFNSVKTLNPKP